MVGHSSVGKFAVVVLLIKIRKTTHGCRFLCVARLHGEPMQFWCRREGTTGCAVCFRSGDHVGHDALALTDAFDEMEKKLQFILARKGFTEQSLARLRDAVAGLRTERTHVRRRISRIFDDLHAALYEREQALLEIADLTMIYRSSKLEDHADDLECVRQALRVPFLVRRLIFVVWMF